MNASAPETVITIATTIDDGWVSQLATSATSLADSRGSERIRLLLLQGPTLSDASVEKLRGYLTGLGLEFEAVVIPQALLDTLPSTLLFSPLVWYRLLLPQLLPDLDRVLALDADTLVLQSLAPLWDQDFGDNLILAVHNGPIDRSAIGIGPDQPYFNAGVMLLNLAALRAEQADAAAIALGHERTEDLIFAEQDALNVIAAGRWGALHPRWNAMSHLWFMPEASDSTTTALARQAASHSPAVVHFEGFQTVKPWFFRSVHPLRELWRAYNARTPWPIQELQLKTVEGAVLRRLPIKAQYAITTAKANLKSAGRRPGKALS